VNSVGDNPTCSTPAGGIGMGGNGTITVTTKAATASALARPMIPGRGEELFGGGAVLALLVFLGIPARRRSWQVMLNTLALLGVLGAMAACGGGSGGGGGTTDPGTATGSYTFTVTGTGAPAISPAPTTTFTVTVN
jgi:hypothetical protein